MASFGGMKLGVGGAPKKKIVVQQEEREEKKELVLSISEGGVVKSVGGSGEGGEESEALLVIPLPPPRLQQQPTPKESSSTSSSNLSLTASSSANTLVEQAANELLAELTGGTSRSHEQQGLTIIHLAGGNGDAKQQQPKVNMPMLSANLPPELLGVHDDEQRFRLDMSLRAEDLPASSNAYEAIPIEQFGAAMLRGMGWKGPSEEDAQFAKKNFEPVVARDARLGLGAMIKPPDADTRGSKEKKALNRKQWDQKADEKIKKQQLIVGDLVWLRDPLYAGRRASVSTVQGVPGLDRIRICLESDGSLVDIKRLDAVLLTTEELKNDPYRGKVCTNGGEGSEHASIKFFGTSKSGDEENGKSKKDSSGKKHKRSHEEEDEREDGKKKKKRKKDEDERNQRSGGGGGRGGGGGGETEESGIKWLRPGIRVRIVSRKVGTSSSYLQKGGVVDVYGSGLASVRTDDGCVIEGVKQKHLETVLPSTGAQCMVLCGSHKGEMALLLEKRKESEEVVLQLNEELEILVFSMSHVAALA